MLEVAGQINTVNGRIDWPMHETIASLQSAIIRQLTNPFTLARIRDAEVKFGAENVVTIPELMGSMTQSIWSEVWTAPGRNILSMRRDLQRAHLDRLVEFVTDAPPRTPADARSIARMQLKDLQERIGKRLSPPFSFDDYTLAHLNEAQARIEQALEAGLSIEN